MYIENSKYQWYKISFSHVTAVLEVHSLWLIWQLHGLCHTTLFQKKDISPFLCMDSSLKVILCSSITAGAPAVKSTFQEGGNRREGWPWPFKVTVQKCPNNTSSYHWPEVSHMAPSDHRRVLEMSFSCLKVYCYLKQTWNLLWRRRDWMDIVATSCFCSGNILAVSSFQV